MLRRTFRDPVTLCLVLFLLFELWSIYLQGIDVFFRSPIGDGSLGKAVQIYLRLHGTWSGGSQGITLVALITYGVLVTARRWGAGGSCRLTHSS